MKIDTLCVGSLETNCYILSDESTREAIIIDPGADYQRIKRFLAGRGLKPAYIVNTHGHIDHIGADDEFMLPVYIHRDDVALLSDPKLNMSQFLNSSFVIHSRIHALEDNQDIYFGSEINLKVIHTPGHTPGSICLLLANPQEKILFSGDTLFYEGIGRTDFPGASSKLLIGSINTRLFVLDDDTLVYPGHGPASSIGHEKQANPFLAVS